MQKINLKQARELLKEQGYELQIDYDEALLERYDIIADMEDSFERHSSDDNISEEEIKMVSDYFKENKKYFQNRFIKLFDDNDAICDIYWDIIFNLIDTKKDELAHVLYSKLNMELQMLVDRNRHRGNFEIVHYDVKANKRLNNSEFMDFGDAALVFEVSKPINENDEIRLICYDNAINLGNLLCYK